MERMISHVLMERLLAEEVQVPIDVLLVDLWYLDQMMVNWKYKERQYALAGGILRRKFVRDATTAVRLADLWLRLRRAYGFQHLNHVLDFSDDVSSYAGANPRRPSPSVRPSYRHRAPH